jgi:3-keto-L-gulonate-6-phosphate decarboxylase/nucleoside phosphorylase
MFTIDPAAVEKCDAAVVIPKLDERIGLERSWNIDLREPHGRVANKKFWGVRAGDLNLVVAFLDDQGPAPARGIAEQLLSRFDPPLFFLVGTAAGREDKTRVSDVIVSSFIADLTEQRAGEHGTTFRSRQYRPKKSLEDAREFMAKGLDAGDFNARIVARLEELPVELRDVRGESPGDGPLVRDEVIASGATLYVGGKLSAVWQYDDRYRAVDMESGGFASALDASGAEWLVVRGISDYGTPASKREEYRSLAAAAAADFVGLFLQQGLADAHPRKLRRKAVERDSSQGVVLYKSLRRLWIPSDVSDAAETQEDCERAFASGSWALKREAERVQAIDSSPTVAPRLSDILGDRRRLQIALDTTDLAGATSLARIAVECGADLIEVGDPLIKLHGFRAIAEVHEAVPGTPVIAEMATSDWCGSQVEMAAAAGADTVLLLGCRTKQSVTEAANAATRLRIPLMIDIPEELATGQWMESVERAGVQGVAVIGNLDSGSEGVASLSRVRTLRTLTNLPIAVSGGLTEDDFPELDAVPWDVLIVGRGVVGSDTPREATKALARHVRRGQ